MSKGRIITALATILAIPAMAAPAGYFQVPGTETTLKVYGYALVQGVYDIDGAYGVGAGLAPSFSATHESFKEKNQWTWRDRGLFGFTSTTPSALGDINVKIEYRATNDGGAPGMRHCYGQIGNLTVGNTDSIFADWDASPNYIDGDGVLADFYGNGRVLQVSYKAALSKELTAQFAIEQDQTGSTDKYFGGAFVAALGYTADWGHVRGSIAYAKLSNVETATTPAYSGTVLNWGLGANYVIGKGNITAQLRSGLGFYGTGYLDQFILKDGKYKPYKDLAYSLGYSHSVTDAVTVAGGLGQVKYKKDLDLTGIDRDATVTNIFVNVQWQATKTTSFAAEFFNSTFTVSGDPKPFAVKNGSNTDSIKENRLSLQAKFNLF